MSLRDAGMGSREPNPGIISPGPGNSSVFVEHKKFESLGLVRLFCWYNYDYMYATEKALTFQLFVPFAPFRYGCLHKFQIEF